MFFLLCSFSESLLPLHILKCHAIFILCHNRYRLAPKHPFPDPFDDCYNVAAALLIKGEAHGIDPRRVLISGDSAGGNLAASVTFQLKNHHPPPAGQVGFQFEALNYFYGIHCTKIL